MGEALTDGGDSQQFVITLLAIFGRQHARDVWSGGLVRLLNEAGYSALAARAALNRLVARDLLAPVREGRLVYYSITPRCSDALAEGDRRLFSLGERADWDGSWTTVLHTIPESLTVERNRLARRLRFLGFRPVQDSIWLSPNSRDREVHTLAVSLGIEGQVAALVGMSPSDLSVDRLVDRTWELDNLCEKYQDFDLRFSRYAPRTSRGSRRIEVSDDREAFLVRSAAAHRFWQFAPLDPGVPDSLLTRPAARHAAADTFKTIMIGLEEPGRRFFDGAMSPPIAASRA